jgi:hypothetical protein
MSSRLSRSNCSLEMTCSNFRVVLSGFIGDALRPPVGPQRKGTGTADSDPLAGLTGPA